MNLLKQFAGQAVTYGLSTILSRIIYYLVVVVFLSHVLGSQTTEFGTFSFFYAYAAILISLFSFRLDTALFRFGHNKETLDKVFSTVLLPILLTAFSIIVIGYFLCEPIAELINFPDRSRYVTWFAYILAFDVINLIPFAKLRLQNKAKTFALFKVFNVVLSSLLILFFLWILPQHEDGALSWMPKVQATIDWVFIANLIASGVLFFLLLPTMKSLRLQLDFALLKKMLYYSLPLVIVSLANGLIQFFSTPLQEMFLDGDHATNLAQAGVYDLTRRIASLFVMFTTAFNYAAEPFFFNNATQENRETLYGKICRLFTLVGGIIVLGMYLGVDLLKYLIDSNYWESLYLLPVLLMAYLFLGIYYNISIWYKLSDLTWYGAAISIVGAVVTLSLSISLLPKIGYAASAWSTLASYFIMVVLGYYWGQKKYRIPYPIKSILTDLVLISALLFLAFLIKSYSSISVKYLSYLLIFIGFLLYVWTREKKIWLSAIGKPGS